jgi:phosphate uptake regulator
MFKRLFSWWKEDILLKQALEKSALALEKAGKMYSFAMDFLLEGIDEEKSIYDMDKEVNDLQIDIRKKVLEHLTINPEQDVTASLVLTTIIVDIERIGDYAKNTVELRPMCSGKLQDPNYNPVIDNLREKIENSLLKTRQAFIDADDMKAKELMAEFTWIGNKCDSTLTLITGDESLKAREAVVYGLLLRYLKRISAHARNICSSVVNPFHRLGYRPE